MHAGGSSGVFHRSHLLRLMQAIADNGGAVAVETGGAFCICLTASGRVVLWGKLSSGRATAPGSSSRNLPRVAEVMDLPRIKHIAAGHLHALLSDGERVWGLGRSAICSGPDLERAPAGLHLSWVWHFALLGVH